MRTKSFRAVALLIFASLCRPTLADVITVLNFDSVNTGNSSSGYVIVDPTAYFASYGVTLVNNNPLGSGGPDDPLHPGSNIGIINYGNVYGGTALNPISSPNLLEQYQSHRPVSFTLSFATPLISFGFTVPGYLAPSAFPSWTATAYNGSTVLSSANGSGGPSANAYTLTGPGITAVTIASDNHFFAAFGGVPLENIVLTVGPVTVSPSDCLFSWAETNYSALFAPRGAQSITFGPYYFRYYSQTNSYLAVSSTNNDLYYIGVLSGNAAVDLGAVSVWYAQSGCSSATFALTTSAIGSGIVSASPSGPNYSSGTAVTLRATPNAGSTFSGWSGACTGTGSCVVTMDGNKTVTATFSSSVSSGSLTGTWAGTWRWSGPGSFGCIFNDGGSMSVTLTQTGTTASGSNLSAGGIESRYSSDCSVGLVSTDSTGTISLTGSGTVFNLQIGFRDDSSFSFSGTATLTNANNTLTGTFVRTTGGTGSFTLNRQ